MKVYENVACCGVDVHYKSSQVTMRDATGQIVRRERLVHPDREALRKRLIQWPQGVPVAMEASFGWGWLSDLMEELGLKVHLSNCFKVDRFRETRGIAKNNKKDADLLSELPLESARWWEVWRAPNKVRNLRELVRYRSGLVKVQTMLKNRIHALFHRHGIFHEYSDLFGKGGCEFLAELCQGKHEPLTENVLFVLHGHLVTLEQTRYQLCEIAKKFRHEVQQNPVIERLRSIPGIGLVLAFSLASEIGLIDRFRNHKALASYSLLAPIACDTGEEDPSRPPKGRHIGHRGNHTLKWTFIEAAHGAVRRGGKWRALFDRYTDKGQRNCNRGYIKVARELVKVVYIVWKREELYREAPLKTNKKKSRSGTGQF